MHKDNLKYYETLQKLSPEQKKSIRKYLITSSNNKTIGRLRDAIELADYENNTNTTESIFFNSK